MPALTEVADIQVQLTTHLSIPNGWKAELAWLFDGLPTQLVIRQLQVERMDRESSPAKDRRSATVPHTQPKIKRKIRKGKLSRLLIEIRDGIVLYGLTSHSTHYRSFRRRFFRSDDPTNSVIALKDDSLPGQGPIPQAQHTKRYRKGCNQKFFLHTAPSNQRHRGARKTAKPSKIKARSSRNMPENIT